WLRTGRQLGECNSSRQTGSSACRVDTFCEECANSAFAFPPAGRFCNRLANSTLAGADKSCIRLAAFNKRGVPSAVSSQQYITVFLRRASSVPKDASDEPLMRSVPSRDESAYVVLLEASARTSRPRSRRGKSFVAASADALASTSRQTSHTEPSPCEASLL